MGRRFLYRVNSYRPLLVMTISVPYFAKLSHSSLDSRVTLGSSLTSSSSGTGRPGGCTTAPDEPVAAADGWPGGGIIGGRGKPAAAAAAAAAAALRKGPPRGKSPGGYP